MKEKMTLCKQALDYRIERTKEAKPENAPLLYMYGAFGKRLDKDDSVDEVFKNSRATVSLGYIGLYEVCTHSLVPSGKTILKPMSLRKQS
jgi:Oxygen-sensitive ribonucleoside-triphosphate reductase